MWRINSIKNDYLGAVAIDAGYSLQRGEAMNGMAPNARGNLSLTIPKKGIVDFIDIGNQPLGPTNEPFGVHIQYGNKAWVYRYEGTGAIDVGIAPDGQLILIGLPGPVHPLPLAEWAGTYQTESRNAAGMPWTARPALKINSRGELQVGTHLVRRPVFNASTATVEWVLEGPVTSGTPRAGRITLDGTTFTGQIQDSPTGPQLDFKGRRGLSPEQAIQELSDGNDRYRFGTSRHPNLTDERRAQQATGQTPFAVIFGCVDSRAMPELLFDQGIGDLFVVRTAGPVLDDAALGSIEYAVKKLQVPLIVVMGHEYCGAVKATVDAMNNPSLQYPGKIGTLVNAIRPAVEEVRRLPADEQVDAASMAHVLRTARALQQSPVIAEALAAGKLKILPARYDLDEGVVQKLVLNP
jgi:carbonic anhydrase